MIQEAKKILIVDDEPDILEFLDYNLSKEGFEVHKATDGNEAIIVAKKVIPNLILLDIMMPDMDGIEACKELRTIPELQDTVISFLTARNEDYSQIIGFDVGADDYISKPIKPRVLLSRIKALLRRTRQNKIADPISEFGSIEIDKDKYLVYKDGTAINLPKKEFELLSLLTSKPGRVFRRDEILNNVWGHEVIVGDRTIDVHIRKLREKIGEEYFTTIKGIGYKFEF